MYEGKIISIPLGSFGFQRDRPHTGVSSQVMQLAKNVTLANAAMEKDFGSERWNQNALPAGIIYFTEYRPEPNKSRVVALCKDGKVYRIENPFFLSVEVTAQDVAPDSLQLEETAYMLPCGQESTGAPKKLFIFSGNDPVQVIIGDGATRRNIESAPADWTGENQPKKGIIHKGRVVAWLNHRIYFSSATDHEDFTTTPTQLSIFPGEGEGIVEVFSYKGVLFVLKEPFGLYAVNDSESDVAQWTIRKLNSSFGGAGPHCSLEVFDDVYIANSFGTITSLKATDATGDVASADLFKALQIERLIFNELNPGFGKERHFIYYPAKRIAYCTYRGPTSLENDKMLQFSFNQQDPQVTLIDKDQPNCLALIKDSFNVDRPYYGANDGYIYKMDSPNRRVHESGFRGEFWTHNLDFAETEGMGAELRKQFDFVEIVYEPTGDINLTLEHYVDGLFQKSQNIELGNFEQIQKGISTLNSAQTDTGIISPESPISKRVPLGGAGRRISLRCYNENGLESFKVLRLNFYYKLLDNAQLGG